MTHQPEGPSAPKPPAAKARRIIIALGGLAVVAALLLLGPQLTRLLAPPVPTPQCVEPTLTLGATKFVIQSLARAADGSVALPADTPDVAHWVEGTNVNYVFGLSPTPENLELKTALKKGDEATITWANCNSTTYMLSAPEPGAPVDSALLDQSASGITVFIQAGSPAEGMLVRGELVAEYLRVIDTPAPGASGIQAEISLLGTETSADKAMVTVDVSILNTGAATFTVTTGDVSLTPEGAGPLASLGAEPSLPREIKPGASETIQFTFARPSSGTAVFKVFDVEFDLEGF